MGLILAMPISSSVPSGAEAELEGAAEAASRPSLLQAPALEPGCLQ
eukprot:CAMPEP_0178442060 /NCGR_PEP_ID=MMETSP0689_2-20121128/37923_1 /TAXON_ID=160604 /ORGANISM="Amphidinium massartii, Strain CS-259" /LENGTH=45 /DNA_ID= /DNA_START= /DNA_END= /DNA_ORIENTATION=